MSRNTFNKPNLTFLQGHRRSDGACKRATEWNHVQADTTELNPTITPFTYSRSRFLNSLNTPGPKFSILLKCRYLGGSIQIASLIQD